MNINNLAAMSVFYTNDTRVVPVDAGYAVSDRGQRWLVARDDNLYWRAYGLFGKEESSRFDTPDEAIHAVIGDPR